MKKKIFIIVLAILIIAIGCYIIKHKTKNNPVNITETEREAYDYIPKLYYTQNERKIYSYGLDKIEVKIDDKYIELKKYLVNNSIDDFINLLDVKDALNDGGTIIYDDGGTKKYSKDGITVIKCNTLEGNKDIYIGNKDMTYKSNFCKNDITTIVRTYKVLDINKYTKQQYEDDTPVIYSNSYEVSLIDDKENKSTVILNNISSVPEKGKTYAFEFQIPNSIKLDDTTESLFKNGYLVEIREVKNKNTDNNESTTTKAKTSTTTKGQNDKTTLKSSTTSTTTTTTTTMTTTTTSKMPETTTTTEKVLSDSIKLPLEYGKIRHNYGSVKNNRGDISKQIDIDNIQKGDKVYSITKGLVVKVVKKSVCGGNQLYINYKIDDKYYLVIYQNLDEMYVERGEWVDANTIIATIDEKNDYDVCSYRIPVLKISAFIVQSQNVSFITNGATRTNPNDIIKFPDEWSSR